MMQGTSAGNLRAASYEELADNTDYTITVNYGGETGNNLICSYTDGKTSSKQLEAYNSDVFNSVTKDAEYVYVKLVNADNVDKATQLNLRELSVESTAKLITLTGDSSLVHVPNVNKKNDEKVVPTEQQVSLSNNAILLQLPANSVNVLVLDLKA